MSTSALQKPDETWGLAAPGIRLRGVRKEFGPIVAVDHLDLDVHDGEFFAVLGPSGSGKTTVLRMIAGFEVPTAGTIELAGIDATTQPPFRRDVNTVFQDYALFPHMTVEQNVGYGLRVKKIGKNELSRRVGEILDMVRLHDLGKRKPSQLSGGQRQRIALARALVNGPRVLLLDEPLGALDLKLRERMQIELKAIQRRVGITFVFVTHDQNEALTLCDRLAVMRDGRIEQIGPAAQVYESPANRFVAEFVGTSNVISGKAAQAVLGSSAAVAIRPEKIQILRRGDIRLAGDPHVDGVIREIVYAGSETRIVVDSPTGARFTALQLNSSVEASGFERGSQVTLTWHRDAARVIDD